MISICGPRADSLAELDLRRVGALWQFDADRIVAAVAFVIFAQPIAQARRLHAHDWIGVRIEFFGAIEDFASDVIALDPLAAASKRFIDDVFEEALPPPRLRERSALENAVEPLRAPTFWSDWLKDLNGIAVTTELPKVP